MLFRWEEHSMANLNIYKIDNTKQQAFLLKEDSYV